MDAHRRGLAAAIMLDLVRQGRVEERGKDVVVVRPVAPEAPGLLRDTLAAIDRCEGRYRIEVAAAAP